LSTRTTPYELIIEPLETAAFPAIRDEAVRRGRDTRRRDQFVLLGFVGATLKEWVADDAPAEAIEQYADLLFHGFQFWSFGRRLYAFDEGVTRLLTQRTLDLDEWALGEPAAYYLQYPYQRLWARVAPEAPFEPVDGCFVLVDETEPAPGAGLHLRALLVLGLRRDRPGISLVSYRTDLEPRDLARRGAAPRRDDGVAFANLIPGGERRDYRAIATTSEFEALVIRSLSYIHRHAESVTPEPGSAADGETHLPHRVVRVAN
jgi:hypothetical protein